MAAMRNMVVFLEQVVEQAIPSVSPASSLSHRHLSGTAQSHAVSLTLKLALSLEIR